jgi:predicted ATPase/DNA-binding SARP family transcriptional activator
MRLFGPLDIRVDGRPLPRLRSYRGRHLLALLALRAGREVEREWLAGVLWPDSVFDQAFYNLRRCLSELRHVLDSHARCLVSPTPHTLRLDIDRVNVDVAEFDAALARGDAASLRRAVELCRGPLLEDCAEVWVLPERTRRRQLYLEALESLATAAMARPDPEGAAHYLRLAVAADPLSESTQRRLLEALAAGGNYAAATQAYRDLRLRLHQELNAAPAPETTALYERIRAAARKSSVVSLHWSVVSSETPDARGETPDAGSHETERSMPSRGHLPHPPSSLVGRDLDLAEVRARLGAARLVTLIGVGGVGKTRLAIQAAHEVAEEYPDGAWFIDLAPLSDPALLPQAVAQVLGIREQPGRSLSETLASALEEQSLLLVLDNCEHLIEVCAPFVDALLLACPRFRVLATSRVPLRLPEEVRWRVPSLPVPPPGLASAGDLLEYAAVRLFVERVAQVHPGFRLTAEHAAVTVEICARLDGIPLAIELAAARVPALSVQEIAGRLEDRFGLLTGGSRAAPPRQQTLQATLDWSYRLLAEPEQVLLRCLSVFAGSFTLEAAEAVCADGVDSCQLTVVSERTSPSALSTVNWQPSTVEVLDLLTRLVDASLVVVEHSYESLGSLPPDTQCPTRYRLLETVREYAWQRLANAGEAEMARERHTGYFFGLVARWAREFDRLAGYQFLESEYPDIRTALEWSLTSRRHAAAAIDGARAMQRFWNAHGYHGEGRAWWRRALAAENWIPPALRALALHLAGELALLATEQDEATSLCQAAATEARRTGDTGNLAWALLRLGEVARRRSDPAAARSLFEESLALARASGTETCVAWCLSELGWIASALGDAPRALAYSDESRALFRRLNDPLGTIETLHLAGAVLVAHGGDRARARLLLEESLALARRIGDATHVAWTLADLGDLARREGRSAEARALLQQSLALRRAVHDRIGIASALSELAFLALEEDDPAAARPLLEESLVLRRQFGELPGVARMLFFLGIVAQREGDLCAARSRYEESLTLGRAIEHSWVAPACLLKLGLVETAAGGHTQALSLMAEALALWQAMGHQRGIGRVLRALACRVAAATVGRDDARRAALLFGAAGAFDEAAGLFWGRQDQADFERLMAAVRASLGEQAFAAAWVNGQAMALEEAIRVGLGEGLAGA